MIRYFTRLIHILLITGCATKPTVPHVNDTVEAGTSVKRGSATIPLYKGNTQSLIKEGGKLPKIALADGKMQDYTLGANGIVRIINIVPSLDTKVCDVQTHELGEAGDVNPAIERIVISRDLPAAQQRFATESKLTNIKYLSDYKSGEFGRATGLLMKNSELLARAVIVVDGSGIVRHYQIVPDIGKLPNIQRAIEIANRLSTK